MTQTPQFQSTHSLRSATNPADIDTFLETVSIHALLAECDCNHQRGQPPEQRFNPRTPCGVRLISEDITPFDIAFQSTHSLRSATLQFSIPIGIVGFNPRTPCGVRPVPAFFPSSCSPFQSTHSLRSATLQFSIPIGIVGFNPRTPCGVRPVPAFFPSSCSPFQSTHSLRSATNPGQRKETLTKVSIHALLAECDPQGCRPSPQADCFNPRTPCGVRLAAGLPDVTSWLFQSTHSLRSATSSTGDNLGQRKVSIHALLAECDGSGNLSLVLFAVSIHALLAECDLGMTRKRGLMICFNPRTPCGVRPAPGKRK